jgi:stage IV sporulation protein FB
MTEPINRWEEHPSGTDDWSERSSRLLRTLTSLLLYVGIYFLVFRDMRSILLLVLVIIVHESGHFLAMKMLGYTDIRLFFVPFFGAFVSGRHDSVPPFRKALMILAGPLPGILIGMSFLFLYGRFGHWTFYQLGLMFLLLNVFNLFPVKPLDGGQLLYTVFPRVALGVQSVFTFLAALAIAVLAISGKNYLFLAISALLLVRMIMQIRKERKQEGQPSTGNSDAPSPNQQVMLTLLWLLGLLSPLIFLFNYTNGRFLAE